MLNTRVHRMGLFQYGLYLISYPLAKSNVPMYPITKTETTKAFISGYLSKVMLAPLVNFPWVIFRDVSSVSVMMENKTQSTFGKSTKRKENQFWRR